MTAASRIAIATSALRKAEQGAISGKSTDNKSGGSLYTGSGRPNKDNKKSNNSKKLKKRLTYIILAAALGGGVAFLGSSNSLLAPALEALYTEATDTQYASNSQRYTRIMRYALSGEGSVTTSWSGKMRYGRMSTGFQKRLAKQGIEVIDSGSGRTLRYTHTDADGITTVKDIDADNFLRTYQNDVDFRDSYVTAKRGRVASFFDNVADRIYKHLGISRNLFDKFKTTGDADADMARYRKTMSERFEGNETSNRTTTADKKPKKDPDTGATITNPDTGETEYEYFKDDTSSSGTSSSQADAEAQANSLLNSILGKVSGIVNAGCMVMQVGTMISTLVAANEIYQSINYFMGLTENISKMKAGYGDESAINEVLNFFSTPADTEYTNFANVEASGNCNSTDNINDCKISLGEDATGNESGTPLEANGVQMMLAYAPAKQSTNDRYSLERTGNAIVRALSSFGVTMVGCNIAKITTSAISIIVSLTPAGLAKIAGNIMVNALVGTAISFAASAFIGFLVPTIAKALFTNAFENATGIPAGELYTRGAVASNTRLGRSGSGQSPSSEEVARAYNKTTQEVLALDAEIDRKNLSPLDITNKNTFFGNIAYNLLLPLSTTSSITSTTSSIARSTSAAIASLVPGVSASGSNSGSNYMTTFGHCAQLESIGAVGDIYCDPIVTTDTSTIDLAPDDATYERIISSNLDYNNDSYTVRPNSQLDWYIKYCDNRDSPFGVLDQNILSSINPVNQTPGADILQPLINSLPIIGDLMDIRGTLADISNEEWATGAVCINNSAENPRWDSEIKYYQRYVEDMRILEQMGAFEEEQLADDGTTAIVALQNPVSAAEDRHREEYPIDNSYIGYLSRISGLTKDNVETVLALVEYYNYIELYDPDTRIAFDKNELTNTPSTEIIANLEHEDIRFKNTGIVNDISEHTLATKQYIVYADLRNRNYVA